MPKKKKSITPHSTTYLEDVPKVIFRINPNIYPMILTRSVKRMLDQRKDFIIVEIYRCMPLLGDETEQAPDWTVHIVRYDIVFTDEH